MTLFDQQLYEVRPDNRMITDAGAGKLVTDPTILFKKDAIIEHVQSLRALSYSCINQIFTEQTSIKVREFCDTKFKHMPKMLIKDVMFLPKQLKANKKREPSDAETEFNNEAIELFTRIMSKDQQLAKQFA